MSSSEKPKSFVFTRELRSSVFADLDQTMAEESKKNRRNGINLDSTSEEPAKDSVPMVLNGRTGQRYPIDFDD